MHTRGANGQAPTGSRRQRACAAGFELRRVATSRLGVGVAFEIYEARGALRGTAQLCNLRGEPRVGAEASLPAVGGVVLLGGMLGRVDA